ncbi:hypothetical protein F66182_5321 [Fusarium sp. NRRL 66182]|nr:hypothetical protein F66182_5321 [Fusarium sp. NRRL 66182]
MFLSTSLLLFSAAALSVIQGSFGFTAANPNDCPGVLVVDGNNVDYCCVGGDLDLSTCEGWPICTGSSWSPKTRACSTTVPVTASDYESRVKSASSRYLADAGSITGDSTRDMDMDMPTATATGDAEGQAASTSGAHASETDNAARLAKTPGLVGGLVGGACAILIAM